MDTIPESVWTAFKHLGVPLLIEPITMGLINKTYVVTTSKTPAKYILQEVSPIFETAVTEDSLAVALHLEQHGIDAPKPYKTAEGKLYLFVNNRVFRALKFIDGTTSHVITTPDMAKSAGMVVGEFHLAMIDFLYDYRSRRRHGGDYQYHQASLITALNKHTQHDFFARAKTLAEDLLPSIEEITSGLVTTPRHIHGDPKVSNILFNDNKAICLVDFDTLVKGGWSLEMGDALRSWCNPYAEDVLDAHVDLGYAEAALVGYSSVMRGAFSAKEAGELIKHTQAISLCLSIRYLADVLNESYFCYDAKRFARACEHQWLKAQAMYLLFLDFRRKESQIASMINDFLLPRGHLVPV